MSRPVDRLFTEADLQRINQALSQLEEAQQVIDAATQAGIDVTSFSDRAKQNRESLLRIKNTFFPGR